MFQQIYFSLPHNFCCCCLLRDRLETENKFLAANALDSNGRKKSSARAQTKQYQSVCLYLRFIQTKQFVCFSVSFKRNLSLCVYVSVSFKRNLRLCVSHSFSLSVSFIRNQFTYFCVFLTNKISVFWFILLFRSSKTSVCLITESFYHLFDPQ